MKVIDYEVKMAFQVKISHDDVLNWDSAEGKLAAMWKLFVERVNATSGFETVCDATSRPSFDMIYKDSEDKG